MISETGVNRTAYVHRVCQFESASREPHRATEIDKKLMMCGFIFQYF